MSKPNFTKILQNLKPDLVIYDMMQQWAERVVIKHNIPAAKLVASSAAVISYLLYLEKKPGPVFPFPDIYLRKIEQVKLGEMLAKSAKDKENDDGGDHLADRNVQIVRDDDGKIHRGEIAGSLKDVITAKTGGNLRRKVRDMSKNLKSIRDEEMDAAAEVLIQLCKNSNKCK